MSAKHLVQYLVVEEVLDQIGSLTGRTNKEQLTCPKGGRD